MVAQVELECGFQCFHLGGISVIPVLMALQMQRGVQGEMRVMRQQILVLRGRFTLDYRRANHYITRQRLGIVVDKSQHVGGVILAAIIFVQLAPFRFVDDAQGDACFALQRNLEPAPQLRTGRQVLRVAGILNGQGKFIAHFAFATNSPRNVWRTTWVIFTSTKPPIRLAAPLKFTTRLLSVRAANSCASSFYTPSTKARCVVPSIACATAFSCSMMRPCKRFKRSALTSCGVSSRSSAAGVPGRGLYR